ncbi:ESAT-6 like protein ESXT [Mycobacteroides abscessus subsp. abscessus]|uniref:WXG100 family type VII secretion target n=1 Tax=Mycobacteroides abscessus TaxID=36809 RepID=UPI000926E4A5|nr:WXG100 family type VII secretion target [Mycobacteroides abscessus]MBB4853100.1 WXG100 family type VII secretion target [Mycobacteroides chelonae]MBE5449282.1 hypothetical protein [Mycobacteroides abscessus]MDO3209690.1 WXG100 family type VII secretion target [Mycobacteroides abscessus subsp. abscessus]SHU77255.1 ESAT-6 like protein ESXT [Mycobacteroides abscessus subsp. abscessus]SHW05309.1 ESAT-6 like protein ESXT [Mycobacteroides abscessus subsp. abscessus]
MTVITYNHAQIDALVDQLNNIANQYEQTLADLQHDVAPLANNQGQDAGAYQEVQKKWHQQADIVHQIMAQLNGAVHQGNLDAAHTDQNNAGAWHQ